MKPKAGLNQQQLRTLVKAQTKFELVARSFNNGGKICWTMDVVLAGGDVMMVCKARQLHEPRVWKQLSALHRFVRSAMPEVESFSVLNAPAKTKQERAANSNHP